METSLRYAADSKPALRIHAKQKFLIDPKTHLQFHGELDTRLGVLSHFSALLRRFYPDFSASFGGGMKYDKREKVRYVVRGKKSFPVTTNGEVRFNVKGRCDFDKEFKEKRSTGAAELSWAILNFQKEQDVRIKFGYEVLEQLPYFQIRENNWTFNADGNGKWNVRYDL
ncbi:hypothetical protein CsatB_007904 [Cannabis sativa]|uniref:Uncharacterized protein n=1 Tax=Cannabis sativa TaxID=3483 RepID=A0A7J6FIN1_CANSA|nr:outer envelope pore protein 21A, chloroplastic [Cannabis sativa]KAF4370485.1 hypothetical protein G4B88_005206 [Cannabis sativa]